MIALVFFLLCQGLGTSRFVDGQESLCYVVMEEEPGLLSLFLLSLSSISIRFGKDVMDCVEQSKTKKET